ncbi:glutamine amidotransferase [Flavobacteriaceae bacterium TP-CH-4]|uniref:Glutamine amidotransferase n=1 Tax=Pelagihabitans pacificus TaxID=2696054 RepID=A0A967AR51_9FLAO|nr:glutamine amidotransferase [Pelagihabitans pacificus]NHF58644.1 glutamine amidotransferase [Pelagihabitans pacificus]
MKIASDKKILLLQMRPEDVAADSEFEAFLRVGGLQPYEVDRFRLEQGIPSIDLRRYSAIIAGGSPFDVSLPEKDKSNTQKAIEVFYHGLFDQVVPSDFPFLGACSGNGLLGSYCGTPISTTYGEPIGSVDVTMTEEGMRDPLLKGLPRTFSALVGHKEACDIVPKGAVLLGSSPTCPVQMFRVNKNIYATQFHPEADADEFILRIHTYRNHGYFDPEEAESLIAAVRRTHTPVPKILLQRFVARYKTSG